MGRGGRLTVWEANTSRLTTKLRWVVETCHRDVKIWRFFAHAQPMVYIRHEHKLIRLLCACKFVVWFCVVHICDGGGVCGDNVYMCARLCHMSPLYVIMIVRYNMFATYRIY